ncbi:unnamed protein product [Sphagnum compactum]
MAGFFTLPELRAELQTMGHDDIPDDLICAFLSQLQLTQVPADEPQQSTTARAKVLPVSKNPKPYVYGSDAYRPSHGALPKSSSRSGAVTSRGLPEWEPDYLISAFHGKWEEEFSLGFQMDPHRDWGGFSGKSNIRGNASFPSINPSTQVELDAIDCKQQVFKEWKAIMTRGNDQKTVVSCTVDKLLGESVASTQLATVGVSCKPDEAKENYGDMMGTRQEALVRQVLQPCEDLMQELCPSGKTVRRTNEIQDKQYMCSDARPKCPWEPMKDPEECTSGSLLHCKLATSTNVAETVGAASESACRQDDYISSQTHYNFRAVKPACLKENCLMAVNCKPTDRASLMDVSNYGQKKCRTASCQVPNPEMDGWEIGGLVLEKSCLKYAEGCSGSVSKSSRRSTNRRGPGTHQCTAYPESQNFKLDLSFGPAIENPLFDSERHFSCKAPCGLQKCPPSTQTDSMQVLLKPKPSNVMEVHKTKCAQEIHINEDNRSPIKHTISIHSPSPSKKKQAPFNRSSIKENLDMKQTPSPSKHSSHKQSPFSPSSQRKRYQQDMSSQSPSCKTATKGCDASPTVGNTKSQAKGRGFSQIERQEVSPPQRSTPLRGGKIDRVARFAEMQEVWKNDSFLRSTATKRRPQSFHRIFATLHAIEASEQRSYKQQELSNKNLK